MSVHWKSKIRSIHTSFIKKGENLGSDDKEAIELWSQLSKKNIPLWSLKIFGEPEKSGFLIKKGGMSSSLTKRIFHLYGLWLFYFSNENDDARAKGIIPIKGAIASKYELNEKDKKKNEKSASKLQHCISIKTNIPREYVLSCSSEKERDEWIEIIQQQSNKVMSKTGKGGYSEELIKKLLGTTEDVKNEIEKKKDHKHKNNSNGNDSPKESPTEKKKNLFFDDYQGGTANGWVYENNGILRTFDVKTNGTWPFIDDEPGLYINCQYSWDGYSLKAREGSGSKGEFDGKVFNWYCFPMGGFHLLYSYQWDEVNRKFIPKDTKENIPTWILDDTSIKMETPNDQFQDLIIEGHIPPPIILSIAMHSWQWKREGEISESDELENKDN
eukprot:TRINITY_DN247_c0_g1_i2.p1 TRINITY_DN247_c0_g1~~TRINITY_DN247_c0_g1_i2.p1  ORF type:complete len:385 (-),score=113.26 TRINITY_DN247_c0_g1_i2:19-1173(-)